MIIKIVKNDITDVVRRCSGDYPEHRIVTYKILFNFEPSETDGGGPTKVIQNFKFCVISLIDPINIQIESVEGKILLNTRVSPTVDGYGGYITKKTTWATEYLCIDDNSSELKSILDKFEVLSELEL